MMDRKLLIPCIVLGFALICFAGAMAGKRRRDQLWYSINQAQRQSQRTELLRSMEEWKQQLSAREDLEFAQEHARQTLQRLRELEAVLDPDTPQPEDLLTLSREETLDAITDLNHRLGRSRMQLGQHRGRMENLPDAQLLQTRLTQARRRLSELEKTQKALLLAQQALDTALRELQRRFATDITARAGKHLGRLTGGVYDRITIAEDLSIQAARTGENTLRSALWRSEGTGDQNYYVFQYATGYSAAIALSRRILSEGEEAVKDYLGFLSGGCSKSPIDLLKGAGVDMTSPEPVNAALKLFGELIDEMEQLVGEL